MCIASVSGNYGYILGLRRVILMLFIHATVYSCTGIVGSNTTGICCLSLPARTVHDTIRPDFTVTLVNGHLPTLLPVVHDSRIKLLCLVDSRYFLLFRSLPSANGNGRKTVNRLLNISLPEKF